jgi:hypothetical protein
MALQVPSSPVMTLRVSVCLQRHKGRRWWGIGIPPRGRVCRYHKIPKIGLTWDSIKVYPKCQKWTPIIPTPLDRRTQVA